MRIRPATTAGLLLCALAGGCRSTYYDARFGPVTNEVRVATEDGQGQARVLISVRGVRRASDGEPPSAELRVRLENLGTRDFLLEQPSLELLCGDLLPFGPARVLSNAAPQVTPGTSGIYELRFPMPGGRSPDEVNFSGLNLRFTLDFAGERVTTGMQFERIWAYYGPPSMSFGMYYGCAYCD
jgi:hypothetical protein